MDYMFIEGEGDFIFFLHGWGGDKNSFMLVKNYLNNNLVFVSMAGFGQTAEPSFSYSVNDYAYEVKQLIKKLSPNKSVILVCHSFGARVAAIISSENQELVKKLVIVDGAGVKPRRSLKYYLKVRKYKKLKKLVSEGKAKSEVLEGYGSSDYKGLTLVMKQTFVKVVNKNLKDNFKSIKAETLLFWGAKDKETPLYMAKKLKKWIIGSELVVIKGGGHFSYLDEPATFIEVLKFFIS